jgi:hypothetical protein
MASVRFKVKCVLQAGWNVRVRTDKAVGRQITV